MVETRCGVERQVKRRGRTRAGFGLAVGVLASTLLGSVTVSCAQSTSPPPVVAWSDDEAQARDRAQSSGRPLLIRVTAHTLSSAAVPRDSAGALLDHPLWAEVTTREFVPLKKYASSPDEFGWFVGRVSAQPDDSASPLRRISASGPSEFGAALTEELRAAKRPIPGYLALLERELALAPAAVTSAPAKPKSIDTAIFGMG